MQNKKSKTFDAVEMKRQIQERIYDETRDMSPEELLAYFQKRIAQSQFATFLTVPPTSQPQPEESKARHGI